MPLTAVRHVRKMRGGAQSHLLEADDGCWYVVKFRNNPQHPRILVNELVSSVLLGYLKIAVPETALIQVRPDFLAANPEIHLTLGARRLPVEPGWHFGSRYPGDPARVAVYDFLPDALLPQVANLEDFRAILVFDKWVGNADGRQSVFYEMVRSLDDFQPWLEQVIHFPEEVIDQAWKGIPADWIAGEEDALAQLLERLFERRARLPELIAACRTARSNPFPGWQ